MQENFLSRGRKFSPQRLFFSVLHLTARRNNSGLFSALQKTWNALGYKTEITPAKSSLSEYREKVSHQFFKDIFEESLRLSDCYRQKLRGFHVYAVDGDHLDLPASKDVIKNGFRGKVHSESKETHYPKMYTVQVLDVINGLIKDFSYSTEISEVRMARQMVAGLEKNSIAIYDRLHASYQTVLCHNKSENYFLIRVKSQNPRGQIEIQDFCNSKKRAKWIELKGTYPEKNFLKPIPVRFIKIRNPRSDQDIVLMTNLKEDQFSDQELAVLYQRRWEIESSFKNLTDTLKMCEWHTKKFNGILQEIYALFWLVNQVRLQCSHATRSSLCWLNSDYKKANLKLCAELVMDNLNLLIAGKIRTLQQILRFWIHRSVEKRKHLSRSYPRIAKRFGKRYTNASSVEKRS